MEVIKTMLQVKQEFRRTFPVGAALCVPTQN